MFKAVAMLIVVVCLVTSFVSVWRVNRMENQRIQSSKECQVLESLAAGKPVKIDLFRSTVVDRQMTLNSSVLESLLRGIRSKDLSADFESTRLFLMSENLSVIYTGDPNKIPSVWRPVVTTQPASAPALALEPN